MKARKMKRICVIADRSGKGGRDRLSGVLRYGGADSNWILEVVKALPDGARQLNECLSTHAPDALVVLSCNRAIATLIEAARRDGRFTGPVMAMDIPPRFADRIRPLLTVDLDNTAIATASMKLLLKRGHSHFAYVGYQPENSYSDARGAALRRIAESDGLSFDETAGATDLTALSHWLQALPMPCAVITYYDLLARDVLDACRIARLSVPGQVAILSSDNDTGICETQTPSLSSVLPDFEGGAYAAAAQFDRMLRRSRGPSGSRTMSYGVKDVIERDSTLDFRGGGLLVASAVEYIRQNIARPIRVDEIARFCRVSRRLLELRFREILSHGVHEEIERMKLNEVRRLLQETSLQIQEICIRAGYRRPSTLCALFRKRFGLSMRETRLKRTLPTRASSRP